MAREHGSKARIYVEDRDLSGRTRSVSVAREADLADASGLSSAGREWVAGIKAARLPLEGLLDPAAGQIEELLSTKLGSVVRAIYLPQGDAIGKIGYGVEGPLKSQEVGTDIGAAGSVEAEIESDAGAERLLVLHALGAETSNGSGASQDNAASSANGGAGYLLITDAAGTTPVLTAKVQHSADNSVWADLITFDVASVASSRRLTVAGTVNRYLRANWTITGTGPSFTFIVGFARK